MEAFLLTSLKCSNPFGSNLPCIEKLSERTAITVGNFDGFHKGHRFLIRKLGEEAKKRNLKTLLLTFFPHPLKVLSPGVRFCEISDIYEKIIMAEETGVDYFVFIKFTKSFSEIRAREFLEKIIYERLGCKYLLVGYDWRFGYGREGEVELAREVGEKMGFEVGYVEPYTENGKIVSSTLIRRLLKEGRLKEAEFFLGRRYWIERKVIRGSGRGKNIGFPTANLKNTSNLCLKEGVYAVRVNGTHIGVANYGYRPTFGDETKVLEIHLINFEGDLRGKRLRVEFLDFIREERKFSDVKELKKQIEEDIKLVKNRY